MLCSIKVNSNTIELTVHTSCYCILDLLSVTMGIYKPLIKWSPGPMCREIRLSIKFKIKYQSEARTSGEIHQG